MLILFFLMTQVIVPDFVAGPLPGPPWSRQLALESCSPRRCPAAGGGKRMSSDKGKGASCAMLTLLALACAACFLFLDSGTCNASLVPEDGFMPGWLRSGPTMRFSESILFDYIDGGAELFLEFGFKELLVQRYKCNSSEITLELYGMESPEAALGIYLAKSDEETPVDGIEARNTGGPYQITILKGNTFLQVNNFEGSEESLAVMTALATRALSRIPKGRPVRLLENLQRENLIPGSEMLVRGPFGLQAVFTFGSGDVLLLGGRVFAVVGDYYEPLHQLQTGSAADTVACAANTYTRILVLYSDRSSAKRAYSHLVTNLDPYLDVLRTNARDSAEREFVFKDYRDKFGSVVLRGHLMDIRVNLSKEP